MHKARKLGSGCQATVQLYPALLGCIGDRGAGRRCTCSRPPLPPQPHPPPLLLLDPGLWLFGADHSGLGVLLCKDWLSLPMKLLVYASLVPMDKFIYIRDVNPLSMEC